MRSRVPKVYTLSAGSHTLALRGRESYTGLSRLIITKDPSFVPSDACGEQCAADCGAIEPKRE